MRTIRRINWTVLVFFISIGFMILSLTASAAKPKVEGLIDIDHPDIGEAKVEVNLSGALFNLAAKAVGKDDLEAAEFLASLKSVKVRIYDKSSFGGKSPDKVLEFYKKQLKGENWEVLARVKEQDSNVGVYSFMDEDIVLGLVVLIGNLKEVIIVNLAGKIDITMLPKIGKIGDLIPNGSNAQPDFVIKGVVKDAATGKPIARAKVSDDKYGQEPRRGATTDSDGKYKYTTWYEEHTILAQAPGYNPQCKTLITKFLGKEKEEIIDFALVREDD